MKKWKIIAAALFVVFIVSGCAVRENYGVINVEPDLELAGKAKVAVASQDQRDYVVSGRGAPELVGSMRRGLGNPFYVTTRSGRPLADEMGNMVVEALKRKGFEAIPVIIEAAETAEQVREKLDDTGAERLIYLQIKQWHTDTHRNVRHIYYLNLLVLDKEGNLIAENMVYGDENLGNPGFAPITNTIEKEKEAFKRIIEELFNSPSIVATLGHKEPIPAPRTQEVVKIPIETPQSTLSLRKEPMEKLTDQDIRDTVKNYGFFESSVNTTVNFSGSLEDREDGTVTDIKTGLMWQKGGSLISLNFTSVKKYIQSLNEDNFAGYNDWRLPTVDELASLLKQAKVNDAHFDSVFDSQQNRCWSSDRSLTMHGPPDAVTVWVIDYHLGRARKSHWYDTNRSGWPGDYIVLPNNYVKAVRSVKE